MPSAAHALLLGVHADRVFSVSSEELFKEVFSIPSSVIQGPSWAARKSWNIRQCFIPPGLDLPVPLRHPLDDPPTVLTVLVLFLLFLLEKLERNVFRVFRARFVKGDEPWAKWEKLVVKPPLDVLGSVRREP
jgi:hypothetical protein